MARLGWLNSVIPAPNAPTRKKCDSTLLEPWQWDDRHFHKEATKTKRSRNILAEGLVRFHAAILPSQLMANSLATSCSNDR